MKKNLKKITAVGLTAILGAGLLAGCGGDGKMSSRKIKFPSPAQRQRIIIAVS